MPTAQQAAAVDRPAPPAGAASPTTVLAPVAGAVVAAVAGSATAAAGAALLVAGGVALLAPGGAARARLVAAARRLTAADRRRVGRLPGAADVLASPDRRPVAYLASRAVTGLVGGAAVLAGLGGGTFYAVASVVLLAQSRFSPTTAAAGVGLGVVTAAVALQVAVGLGRWDAALARRLLGADPADALRRRVDELTTSRAEVLAAVDEERRRIERDLHDGVQQRLVALGVLLGRARRAPETDRVRALAAQAHDESQDVLRDLREVVWRVYPSALDAAGLRAAVEAVADRASLPVQVVGDLTGPVAPAVRTAAYFVVSEAVTNAVKHARASRVRVDLEHRDGLLVVRVTDDGIGGADPAGGGLAGLARRVAALDGRLAVSSPRGGPTTITAELACG